MSSQTPADASPSQTPAGIPPPGVTPNFAHPNGSLTPDVLGVGITLLTVCTVTVILATVSGVQTRKGLTATDYTRFVGLILTIGYSATVFALSGSAVHQWDLPVSWYNDPSHIKLLYAQSMLLSPCIFFSKLSILLLYFDVFKVKTGVRWLIYVGIVWDVLAYWPGIAIESYFCAPHIGQSWDAATYSNCSHTDVWGIIQGSLATGLDIFIFVCPLSTILSLNMTPRKKIAICVVFATAFFGIVASVTALVFRAKLYIGFSDPSVDFNWLIYQLLICVMVENFVALLVSSMPAASGQIRKLADQYNKLSSYVWSTSSKARSSNSDYSTDGGYHAHDNVILRADNYDVEVHSLESRDPRSKPLAPSSKPFEQIYGEVDRRFD